MKNIHRLWHHVGRRGCYLAFLSLLDLLIAYSLTQPPPFNLSAATIYKPFVAIMPLLLWVSLWSLGSVLTAGGVVSHRVRPYSFGYSAALKVLWGSGYLIGFVERDLGYSRAYQSAALYFAFAGVTLLVSSWQENLTATGAYRE